MMQIAKLLITKLMCNYASTQGVAIIRSKGSSVHCLSREGRRGRRVAMAGNQHVRARALIVIFLLIIIFPLITIFPLIITAPADAEQKSAPQPGAALPVSVEQALYLIRSALLTLNDANRSGNYTVMHNLAAPDFQARNTSADLGQTFADLRRRKFDLFAVALAAPQLTAPPALDTNKMLRLTGFFPTRPQQINFDLLFQNVAGQWRLFGISVATPQAPDAQAAKPAEPGAAAAPGAKASARKGN
jgi:hypothetical protein